MARKHISRDYLEKLADIVCDIDSSKINDPTAVPGLVKQARIILNIMEIEGVTVFGWLPIMFSNIHTGKSQPDAEWIEAAHDEIARLLGDQVDLVYKPEQETT